MKTKFKLSGVGIALLVAYSIIASIYNYVIVGSSNMPLMIINILSLIFLVTLVILTYIKK